MSHLSLALLGPPKVGYAGRALKFRTRKALALLIYLAAEGNTHSREKITTLFWPESDESHGRAMLRTTITHLRDAFGGVSMPAHLIVERASLRFDFTSDFDLDLRALDTAFTLVRAPQAVQAAMGETHRSLLSQLQRAATLYRGDFLDGFSLNDAPDFDNWVRLQREVWHQRMSTVFDRLSQIQSNSGERALAMDTTTRWVAHDPLNESAHRRLMQLHLEAFDRTAALRAYEHCRSILAEELHASPAPETEALAERIRVQILPRRAPARPVPPAQAVPGPPMLNDIPLVGRANEYSTLIEVYHSAQSGQTQVVILTGEAGIGKTRLATEFLGRAAAHGADILQGRAFEMGGRLPYQPLVESLRSRVERENAPDDLLSDAWLAELSRVLPELRDRYPDLPPPTADETTARIRLFEAITRLFQSFAAHAPVVLFIDDVQWADAASLDVLHYAAPRWAESGAPFLLLLSVRTEALVTTNTLTTWLSGLERQLQVTNLLLASLTREDTLHLLQAVGERDQARSPLDPVLSGEKTLTGESPLEELGKWLFSETGGQPFYLIETLKVLLERGLLTPHLHTDGSWELDFDPAALKQARVRGLLPPGVRQIIRTRLDHLSATGLTLLMAGAVLGQDFTFEWLYQVASLAESDALAALDEVLKSGLLREGTGLEERRGAPGTYGFTHDKIRDVVYTELGEARRRMFHRRALDLLRVKPRPASELVQHALGAGLAEPAFHLSLAAGDDAMRLFAVRDAIAQYEQARQVVTAQGIQGNLDASFPTSAMQHLYSQLGRAYELANDMEQAQSIYRAMLAFGRKSGVPPTVPAGHYAQQALSLARRLGLQELMARSLNVLTYIKMVMRHWQEAEAHAQEACALFRGLGNRVMEVDCLSLQASAQINSGRPQAGIETARTAYAISQEIENIWGQANSAIPLAQGLLEIGAYSEALTKASHAVSLARTAGMLVVLGAGLITLGTVYQTMLSLDAARTVHLEAPEMLEPSGMRPLIEIVSAELCTDCALAGAWSEAYRHALRVLKGRTYTVMYSTQFTPWYMVETLVRAGEVEHAREEVDGYGEHLGSSLRYRIPYLRALTVLAESQGEIEQATRHLQEAAQLAEEIGLPGELWSIQAALGEVYQQHGDENQASQAFARAAQIVESLAGKIEDERQRATFLLAQPVQHIFQRTAQN